VSTVVAGLYGGFVMYQKIEEVAGLDLGEYQQQMDLMDAQVQQTVEYTRDIKNNLRDDLLRVEQQADRVESLVRKTEEKVRSMIDAADLRFESQRERLRSNQDAEMKDLEDKLMGKLQRALDNPLAD
jgi:mevalonate kinase